MEQCTATEISDFGQYKVAPTCDIVFYQNKVGAKIEGKRKNIRAYPA